MNLFVVLEYVCLLNRTVQPVRNSFLHSPFHSRVRALSHASTHPSSAVLLYAPNARLVFNVPIKQAKTAQQRQKLPQGT